MPQTPFSCNCPASRAGPQLQASPKQPSLPFQVAPLRVHLEENLILALSYYTTCLKLALTTDPLFPNGQEHEVGRVS